ncbi:MAG: hypothetical protein JRJ49_01320 [Deltaproteobacteria bacterium]|nr:hypothetical protein [Deltaproteobacteria bacterium]
MEQCIGYLKQKHCLYKNRLKGIWGDKINAILSAAGINFKNLLKRANYFYASLNQL